MLLHTSPNKNLLNEWEPGEGRFGSGLFFVSGFYSNDAYVMTCGEYFTYVINDEDEDKLKIARRWDLDIPESLTQRLNGFYDGEDYDNGGALDADDSWDAQAELLELAIAQGYDAVEDEDEQGRVFIVNGDKVVGSMLKRIEDTDVETIHYAR